MRAVYKREIRAYFHSVTGWLFLAASLFFAGLYFTALNLAYGSASIAGTVSSVLFLFMLTVPVLTMRILAEERRQKTDQLLLSAPVSVPGIVTGKYLAAFTVFGASAAVMSIYPLMLGHFGQVSYQESYTALFGYILYGMAAIAVGVFVSSVTESQMIAAVLCFAVLFASYLMSGICGLISRTGNLVTRALSAFDMLKRFTPFTQARLEAPAVVYFLTITALFLFLTCRSVQKGRWSISAKAWKEGAYNITTILAVCAAAIAVNFAAGRIPDRYASFDMTDDRLYSLTEQTKELLSSLRDDVTIYVLQNEEEADTTLAGTLERYEGLSDHIRTEYVDPSEHPDFYTKYTTDAGLTTNSLIVESGKRYKVVDYGGIYEIEYDYDSYASRTTGYDGEGQITSALSYVTEDDMPKMYMLEGHDELELSTRFMDGIRKENIELESLNLLKSGGISEDADCLIVNAPVSDLSAQDADQILAYAKKGGSLFITTAMTDREQPNLESVLAYYGISPVKGMVMEADKDHFAQSPYYLLPNIGYDAVTQGLDGGRLVFAPYSRGFAAGKDGKAGVTELLTTSESSYSKTDVTNYQSCQKTEDDIAGPFMVGLKAVREGEDGKSSTLLLYGSETLFTDEADQMVSGSNLLLFNQSLSSLTEHEANVSVPVKSYSLSYIMVPRSALLFLAVMLVLALPSGMLTAGFVIWLRRRK